MHKKPFRRQSRKEWSAEVWQNLLNEMKNPVLAAMFDSLLSSYEKNMIVHRIAAIAFIKKGMTYRQIGRELWLSPTTIRSLKKTLVGNAPHDYQSYRSVKNGQAGKRKAIPQSRLADWIDYCISTFPKKNGPRWKITRSSSL